MTVLTTGSDVKTLTGPQARRAMATAMSRATQALAGAEPVDERRTAPIDHELRTALTAVERSEDRAVRRAAAAARSACAYLAAGRAEDAFLALQDALRGLET